MEAWEEYTTCALATEVFMIGIGSQLPAHCRNSFPDTDLNTKERKLDSRDVLTQLGYQVTADFVPAGVSEPFPPCTANSVDSGNWGKDQ